MTMPYNGAGLETYANRPKVDPLAKRPNESDEAHRRRIAPFLRHAETVADEDWSAFRAVVDGPTGQGAGLDGRTTPQQRAAALGTLGFGGSQVVPRQGHLVHESNRNQPAPARVWTADVRQDQPVLRCTPIPGSSGEGWMTTRV